MRMFRFRSSLASIIAAAPLCVAAPVFAEEIRVLPQPGFNTAEAARLLQSESDRNDVIAAQLKLGSEYVRLGMRRLANGDLQDGTTGWFEPTYLGYKLVSK